MSVLENAQNLFNLGQYEECIKVMEPYVESHPEDLEGIQVLSECYAESGDPESAYRGFLILAEADPEGTKYGFSKYLWLGQLSSGKEGVHWYDMGINMIRKELSNPAGKSPEQLKILRSKMSEALCGQIEIWMTDLCMEPEAESSCEKLITEALMVDDQLPESWSILGSIRISQQRDDDAIVALNKSWELFSSGSYECGAYSIPQLIRLGQSLIELDQYETVLDLTQFLGNLDDEVVEVYYLNGLAHFELYNIEVAKSNGQRTRIANRSAVGAREAWNFLIELSKQVDDDYSEMIEDVQSKLASLPEIDPDEYSESEDEIDEEIVKELEDDNL